jgi:hypothetical protein
MQVSNMRSDLQLRGVMNLALENRWAERSPGFESRPIRHFTCGFVL